MIWKQAVYDMKQKQERIKRYPLLAKNRDDVISLIILDFIGDTMNKTLFYIIIIWQEENRSPRISLRTDAPRLKKRKKNRGWKRLYTGYQEQISRYGSMVQSNMIVLPAIYD